MAEGRTWLDPMEVSALLRAYAIPDAPVTLAKSAEEAGEGGAALRRGRRHGWR